MERANLVTKRIRLTAPYFLSLLYHDIFEYPLKNSDLARWRMGGGKDLKFVVEKTGNYYHLSGRTHLAFFREKRKAISRKKLLLARKGAGVLSRIPTICFMGISGSLAMRNAIKESDIDLFIITKRGTLWSTRILVKLLGFLTNIKMRTIEGSARDYLCLNLWLDEANLTIPDKMHNLYTAHEVLQVVPLVNREHTFEKFLEANEWVLDYWPKAAPYTIHHTPYTSENLSLFQRVTCYVLRVLHPIAYRFQLWHMRSHRTRELIEPGRAFFHPINWGEIVLRRFAQTLNFSLKNFWGLDKPRMSLIK